MKISEILIRNVKAISSANIGAGDLLALVGRNNSAKSTVLEALDFFFDPSKRKLDLDWFPGGDTTRVITIQVSFADLSDWEAERFRSWLARDGTCLTVAREIRWGDGDFEVDTIAFVPSPEELWLRSAEINRARIDEWWAEPDQLRVGGVSFRDLLGTAKPTVGAWKDAAVAFCEENGELLTWTTVRAPNPRGAANVLKGTLPEFILVPAVRDVSDEVKVTQSNPFGRLIHALLDKVSGDVKEEISDELQRVAGRLNRVGGDDRLAELSALESSLGDLMTELMDCDVELEMGLPTLHQVFGAAQLLVDDGVRTPIERKGHGMQRSMILTILRHYAQVMNAEKAGDRAGERSTIIAIEEPELYMHPRAQRSLMSVLAGIAEGRDQVIYTTHSSLFVDISRFDDICIMRREPNADPLCCSPTQLTMEMLLSDLLARKGRTGTEEGIRSLYAHAFDPVINEGFFADKVVVVEGPSERYALPVYAEVLGYDMDRENVAVVHADGKGSMDRLARVFTGLGIPTFLWFDGDKGNPDGATTEKTVELLELIGDPVEDITAVTTVVAARYAVLEETFEATMRAELPHLEAWLAECSAALGPTGKPLQHRFLATKVRQVVNQEGRAPADVVPTTIQSIVERIRELTTSQSVLHPTAEALRRGDD